MPSYQERIKEFENNYTSAINREVEDLSKTFDILFEQKDSKRILSTIQTAISLLSKDFNIPTKMQLSYDIAGSYHDLREIENTHNESHLEKELYYHRNTLDLYESNFLYDDSIDDAESKVAKYIAMRTYTNLGNVFNTLGRYIAAIDCFQDALLLSNDFSMASLNLSYLLFRYAPLQLKSYEQNYFHHACYYYYKQTQKCKINLESQNYLDNLEKLISLFDPSYIKEYLNKPLDLPPFYVDNPVEAEYRDYLITFRLFLDPCLDILSDPCFAVDSINLPFDKLTTAREKELAGLFNQIKQEYNLARYLWYKISVEENGEHYIDRQLDLVNTGDCADHSFQESLMRTSFKTAYALFDRIGYFINEYFQVGLTDTKISFKNVWKNQLCDRYGSVHFTVPNPIVSTHSYNPMINAMYWLQKDFFEDKKTNVTSPHAEKIFQMRNDMEHNCLRTGRPSYDVTFTKYTSAGKIEEGTYKLLKLARELIIYLCLAVGFDRMKREKKILEEEL